MAALSQIKHFTRLISELTMMPPTIHHAATTTTSSLAEGLSALHACCLDAGGYS